MAIGLSIGITACGLNGNHTSDSERKDVESIKKENQIVASSSEEMEQQKKETVLKKTEYPLTITTYNTDGTELKTVYEKAPERVLAVYQGSIETMLALGLEEHLVATAGLDNEVPDEQKSAFSKTKYLDEFTPSLETVTMLEPDMIFSWGSLFQDTTLGDTKGWIEKGVNLYMNTNTHPMQNGVSYSKTLENEYEDILNIGKIFDVQDRAEAIVNDMKDTITKVEKETKGIKEKPTVNNTIRHILEKALKLGSKSKDRVYMAVKDGKHVAGFLDYTDGETPVLRNLVAWYGKDKEASRINLLTEFLHNIDKANQSRQWSERADITALVAPESKGNRWLKDGGFHAPAQPKSDKERLQLDANLIPSSIRQLETGSTNMRITTDLEQNVNLNDLDL